jgi:AcrR family transcriptional regulator
MPELAKSKDRIVAAAVTHFARAGFDGATTEEIARTAKVSHGNLFRYFSSKRELFVAAIDAELERLRLRVEILSRSVNAEESGVRSRAVLDWIADTMENERELVRLLMFAILQYDADLEATFRLHLRPIVELLASTWFGSTSDVASSSAVVSFIATIATLNLFQDVFPDLYGSVPRTAGSIKTGAAAAAGFWLRVLARDGNF